MATIPGKYRRAELRPLEGEYEFRVDIEQEPGYDPMAGPKEVRITPNGVHVRFEHAVDWDFFRWADVMQWNALLKQSVEEGKKLASKAWHEGFDQGRLARISMQPKAKEYPCLIAGGEGKK